MNLLQVSQELRDAMIVVLAIQEMWQNLIETMLCKMKRNITTN